MGFSGSIRIKLVTHLRKIKKDLDLMFRGLQDTTIDSKGRTRMPVRFREALAKHGKPAVEEAALEVEPVEEKPTAESEPKSASRGGGRKVAAPKGAAKVLSEPEGSGEERSGSELEPSEPRVELESEPDEGSEEGVSDSDEGAEEGASESGEGSGESGESAEEGASESGEGSEEGVSDSGEGSGDSGEGSEEVVSESGEGSGDSDEGSGDSGEGSEEGVSDSGEGSGEVVSESDEGSEEPVSEVEEAPVAPAPKEPPPASVPEELRFVVTTSIDPCLVVYPMSEWEIFEKKLASLPQFDPAVVMLKRVYVAGATECTLDKHGRLVIPPMLREHMGLKKDVVWAGLVQTAEIWAKEEWNKKMEEARANKEELVKALKDLGL